MTQVEIKGPLFPQKASVPHHWGPLIKGYLSFQIRESDYQLPGGRRAATLWQIFMFMNKCFQSILETYPEA